MSFETIFKRDLISKGFGSARYARNFKERPNISKGKMDLYSNVKYLKVGEYYIIKYQPMAQRFVSALDMSYDMLLSVFNVNTSELGVYRLYGFDPALRRNMELFVAKLQKERANIEVRLIGLQNEEDYRYLFDVAEFIVSRGLPLMDVDLFGSETRNIALDAKLGMALNVLVQDRLYRPGELANKMTPDQFEAALKPKTI